MPSAILQGAAGQPGPIAYPSGITTGIFNELNFVIPDYIPGLIAKYGNSSYTLISEILGRSTVEDVNTTTNTFSHFEKGRPFGSALVASNVASTVAGANINITLKSPESYNNGATGTQSPFLIGQVVKIRSNGRKFRVENVTRTAGAFVLDAKPLGLYTLITGNSGTQLNAGEGLETFGNQLAGESSDEQGTQQTQFWRYDNTCTVVRATTKSSDLAAMNKTQVNFGGSFYEPTLAIQTMNENMLMNIQDAVIEGVPDANTTDTGTIGMLPEIEARGSEVDYVQYNFAVGDFQNMTNVIDANGGPREYHALQDLYQRQDINNLLFGIYKNGAISYASVGMSEQAAVSYGFKSFSTDTYDFHFNRYKGFGAEATFGYTPTQGDYRQFFGLFAPQGMVADAKMAGAIRPYMQFVYQQNPDITTGQRIYSWSLGYTQPTKTNKANNTYNQISYVGSRVTASEQFLILRGISS